MSLDMDTKTRALGLLCALLDGRDIRPHILALDGVQCITVHNVLKQADDLLKAQWRLMGAPDDVEIL